MGKLFGTDGIRGSANLELTPEMAFRISRIGAYVLSREYGEHLAFLVARDTRISGTMLEGALVAGFTSAGADVYLAGVIPTPVASFLAKELPVCGGVMISASHNPFYDNGIKFFNGDGFKLHDEIEKEMEKLYYLTEDNIPRAQNDKVGRVNILEHAAGSYLDYLNSITPCRFDGLRIVLDCANGAASHLAPSCFRSFGAEVLAIHDNPNGININDRCGSTHPDVLAKAVQHNKAQLGFTFDGDADRVLAMDEYGQLVDGDSIMAILATSLKNAGRLNHDTLVTTVMSNMGLEKTAAEKEIKLLRTKVGDRYVLEEMISGGYNLGGEQSGHIIILDYNNTGDGLLTALQLTCSMINENKPLSVLSSIYTRYPQVIVNCRVITKNGLDTNPHISEAIELAEKKLSGHGRLLVRPSGTEPLIRIMLEGSDEEGLYAMANELAEVIKKELG